jgi:hypothetical protein
MESIPRSNKSRLDIFNDLTTHFNEFVDSALYSGKEVEEIESVEVFDKYINKSINGGADISDMINNIVSDQMTGGSGKYVKNIYIDGNKYKMTGGGKLNESSDDEAEDESSNDFSEISDEFSVSNSSDSDEDDEFNMDIVNAIYNEAQQNIPLTGGAYKMRRKIKVVDLYPFTLSI